MNAPNSVFIIVIGTLINIQNIMCTRVSFKAVGQEGIPPLILVRHGSAKYTSLLFVLHFRVDLNANGH